MLDEAALIVPRTVYTKFAVGSLQPHMRSGNQIFDDRLKNFNSAR